MYFTVLHKDEKWYEAGQNCEVIICQRAAASFMLQYLQRHASKASCYFTELWEIMNYAEMHHYTHAVHTCACTQHTHLPAQKLCSLLGIEVHLLYIGHITINHLQLYTVFPFISVKPTFPPFIFRASSGLSALSLISPTWRPLLGASPVSLSSPLPWHPRTSLHVPLAVRDPEVN